MRPKARLSWLALIGFLFAGTLSAGLYWLGYFYLKYGMELPVPSRLLGALLLVPSLLPGFLIALLVNRLPGVMKLRCSNCHWSESQPVYRTASRIRLLKRSVGQEMAGLGGARAMPAPGQEELVAAPVTDAPEEASVFDQIVDEHQKYHEIKAWIYAEFVSGRTFEEISADMISQGWSKDHAEALVEEGRKATRNRRP